MALTVTRRLQKLGSLHDLLLKACPPCVKDDDTGRYRPVRGGGGFKSTNILADLLGMSPWGVHQWIKRKRIPARRAKQIVELNPHAVTLEDFSPFIYS